MKPSRHAQSNARSSVNVGCFGLKPVTAVVLSVFAAVGCMTMESANAKDAGPAADAVTFDTTFLQTDPKQTVDVARFARGNIVSPGTYTVDVWINDTHMTRDSIRFIATREGESARACFSRKMLEGFGIDFAKVDAERKESATAPTADDCIDVAAVVPEAGVEFDFSEQKLTVTVPQKFMRTSARGYVSPDL